jgi:hypothetical protein
MAGIYITPRMVVELSAILCLPPDSFTTEEGCLSQRAIDGIAEAFRDQAKLVNFQGRVKDFREMCLDFVMED